MIRQRIQHAGGSIHYREYLKLQKLGKGIYSFDLGGFAQCFLSERVDDKKKYAMKIIPKKLLEKPKARQKMLSEIKLHSRAKHKNICDLQRAFEDDDNVYILLEVCSNGNMFDLIKRRKKLTIPETQYFIYQLIDSLCYLHNRQMIHRDVKLGNLLIDSKMNLKLADFGLTTKLEFQGDRKHTVCGTPNYIAPQIIRASMGKGASGHSYEVDVWSTGVIMYLMLIGKAPFQTQKIDYTYQRISNGQFDFPDSFKGSEAAEAKDLLKKILVVDPSKRYTFEEVLSHPFMNPKCGIPKQIPNVCLTATPKFGIFEKYSQNQVKESARNASIMTLRSSVELSVNDDLDDASTLKNNQSIHDNTSGIRGKSKDRKFLLRNVFSTTSLNKSLQKLDNLSRNVSPTSKNTIKGMNQSTLSITSPRYKDSFSSNLSSRIKVQEAKEKRKLLTNVYISQYKPDVIWHYQLNNGYIGTYESGGYKTLYNSHSNAYFEIQGQTMKIYNKKGDQLSEKLSNRRKFLKNFENSPLECQPYISKDYVIYISNIYKISKQNIILFKLSNGIIQAHDTEKNIHLILTEQDMILVELVNGNEISKCVEKKSNYTKCSAAMIKIYLQVKKILAKLNSR